MFRKLFLISVVMFTFLPAMTQNLELGLMGGVASYNGDLNPAIPYHMSKPAFGIMGRYNKGTRWSYTAAVKTGSLASNGQFARVSSASVNGFSANFSDISVVAEFNFFDYFTGSQKDYMTSYIFGGLSYFGTGTNFSQSLGFNSLSIPFGFGFKYSLGKRIGLTAEWRMHKTFTDNLEGDLTWKTGETDSNNNDWFNFTGIGITYKFNLEKRQACNSFKDVAF